MDKSKNKTIALLKKGTLGLFAKVMFQKNNKKSSYLLKKAFIYKLFK